jgi:hypothetical protein
LRERKKTRLIAHVKIIRKAIEIPLKEYSRLASCVVLIDVGDVCVDVTMLLQKLKLIDK